MAIKSKTVDWGGLTLRVNAIETGSTKPGVAGTEVTATAAELNLAADISSRAPIVLTAITAYDVLAANSGKIHVLAAIASDCTLTLPAAAAGLFYEFWFCSTAAEAQNFIITTPALLVGGLLHADVGGTTAAVYANGSSHDTLTIVTPAAGTIVKVICDGTNWYFNGTDSSATIASLA
jgi:hypothetical protein